MSTLAKVFVIINLVLTIVFITMAGTLFHHQKDWRNAFVTLERARLLLHPAQATFLDRLLATLDQF